MNQDKLTVQETGTTIAVWTVFQAYWIIVRTYVKT